MVIQSRLDQARNGPYWQLTLQDRSGSIPARIWSPLSQGFEKIKPGQAVFIRAGAQSFRDQMQLNVDALEFIPAQDIDLSFFVPVSDPPPEDIYRKLMDFLRTRVAFPPWTRLYRSILGHEEIKEALISAPGGKSIHHAYIGGLLEHTLSVCKICDSLCGLYPSLDRDILLVSAALHDLGKSREITAGISREYSDQGKLLGHILLGLEMIHPFLEKAENLSPELIMHLKHIIVSHHGELEFGSPKRPKTHEAFVLHHADNLDAKLNTLDQALKATPEEIEGEDYWSQYQRSMERYLYKPVKTPRPQTNASRPSRKEGPCLLPLKA